MKIRNLKIMNSDVNRISHSEFLAAFTVIVMFAFMAFIGSPELFDALAGLKVVPWPANMPSLHAIACVAVMLSFAWHSIGVYRAILAHGKRDREMFYRSLTITGKLP